MFKGDLLKTWRDKEGISQADAGRRANITQAYWNALEMCKRDPSLQVLSVLSNVTGIRKSILLGEIDETSSPPINRAARNATARKTKACKEAKLV